MYIEEFNIQDLVNHVKKYGEYTGCATSRNYDGLLVYRIEHYMLNNNRFSLHYKTIFDKSVLVQSVLERVEVIKI